MALLFVGILLMSVASGRLGETGGSYFAYFVGAGVVSLSVQAIVGWRHNDRLPPDADHEAPPQQTAEPRQH